MDDKPYHYHNGVDSNQLTASDALFNCPQPAITPIAGTAGATYTAAEQTIINAQIVAINSIITKLKAIGLTL